MKKTFLLLLVCSIGFGGLYSQDAAPFKFKEQKGIAIKEDVLAILFDKNWTSFKQYTVNTGKAQPQKSNFFAIRINADSSFQISGTNYRQNGRWVANGKSLQLQVTEDVKSSNPEAEAIGGTYSIYKITDDELLLVKEMQQGNTEHWVCYFKGTKPADIGSIPMASAAARTVESDKQKAEKENLMKEISMEFFLRGEKKIPDLEKMDNDELISMRNSLVRGKYSREQVLIDEIKVELFMRKLTPPADLEQMKFGQLKKLKKQILSGKYKAN